MNEFPFWYQYLNWGFPLFIFKEKEDQLSLLPTGTSGCCQRESSKYFERWKGHKANIICNKVLVAQAWVTQCDLMDCSSPGFSVHGISQARILEWATISFSRASSPTQRLNSHLFRLQHCRQNLYYLSHQGSPYVMNKTPKIKGQKVMNRVEITWRQTGV